MFTSHSIPYEVLFDLLHDYIQVTNTYIANIDFTYTSKVLKNNFIKNIAVEHNYRTLEKDIDSCLSTLDSHFIDIILSATYLPSIVLKTLRRYTNKEYISKLASPYEALSLIRNIFLKNIELIDDNTIKFINEYKRELSFFITRKGIIYSDKSLKEILENLGSNNNKPFNLYTGAVKYIKYSFNGSKIIDIQDCEGFLQNLQKELILTNLYSCEIAKEINRYTENLLIPPTNLLFINNKNNNYLEFRELLEYAILSTIPNLSVNYGLNIESKNASNISVAFYNNKNHILKTKYAKRITSFTKYLLCVYGHFDMYKLHLNISVNDKVISPIDRSKMMIDYNQKYGKIEELYKIAGIS